VRIALGIWLRGLAMRLRPQTAAAGAVGFPGATAVETRAGARRLSAAFERIERNLSA